MNFYLSAVDDLLKHAEDGPSIGIVLCKENYINRYTRAIALNGSGYYECDWSNPLTNQSEPKASDVMKVDDTWYLGAGIYKAELSAEN